MRMNKTLSHLFLSIMSFTFLLSFYNTQCADYKKVDYHYNMGDANYRIQNIDYYNSIKRCTKNNVDFLVDQAMAFDEPDMIELLLESNLIDGDEILKRAVAGNRQKIAVALLARGIKANTLLSTPHCTVLMLALDSGFMEMAEILWLYGAKVDYITHDDSTALKRAAELGQKKQVKWLLDHGAITSFSDIHGKTARDYATKECQKIIDDFEREHS